MAEKDVMVASKPLQPFIIRKDKVIYLTEPSYNSFHIWPSDQIAYPEGGYDVGHKEIIDNSGPIKSDIETYYRDKDIAQPETKTTFFQLNGSNGAFIVSSAQAANLGPWIWIESNGYLSGSLGYAKATGNYIYKSTAYLKSDVNKKFNSPQIPSLYPRCNSMFGYFICGKDMVCSFYPYYQTQSVVFWIGASGGTFKIRLGNYTTPDIPYNATRTQLSSINSANKQIKIGQYFEQYSTNRMAYVVTVNNNYSEFNNTRGLIKDLHIDTTNLTYLVLGENEHVGVEPIYTPLQSITSSSTINYWASFPFTDKSLIGTNGVGVAKVVMNRWALTRTYTYCDGQEDY